MAGLYIHIPFCESRCIYCGFYSTTSLKLRDSYVAALAQEMKMRPIAEALGGNYPIHTIYLGGGTPSQLSTEHLDSLFKAIQENYLPEGFSQVKEITMECNPDDVTPEFCQGLKHLPINRISMGAQTFSNERLRFLHRRHTAEEVTAAIEHLRSIGIKNISIDLMFGFPGETLADWQSDISQAISLGVEHISAYSLMYEEGTTLYRLLEQEKICEIDEEKSRKMYETLIDMLTGAGYEHYEISNFALPGFRSIHNSSYWHETPYIGIGAAAHSYKRDIPTEREEARIERSWNISDLSQYIQRIKQGELPSEAETLDLNTRYNDLITTALRTSDGIDIEKTKLEFGEKTTQAMLQEAQSHIELGLMKIEKGRLSLTRQGLYISDDVMSDFMLV